MDEGRERRLTVDPLWWRVLAMRAAKASATPIPFYLALPWPEFLAWCEAAELLTDE